MYIENIVSISGGGRSDGFYGIIGLYGIIYMKK
jgi:hypothetical protein